jgi:two-component system CheB/CheR fusion protein
MGNETVKRPGQRSRGATPVSKNRGGATPGAPGASFPIVGVGASAGGLEAFTQLLGRLPANSGMAFVLIQHLDPTHRSFLGEALARATAMPVSQAEDGVEVEADHVYVIPQNADIGIEHARLKLVPRPEEPRPPHLPIDFFFRALAADLGSRAIGVVLSGTASDGTEGLRAIKEEGGITFAQDPWTAKFGGMPRSAIDAGVVDYGLTIAQLVDELVRLSHHPYVLAARKESEESAASTAPEAGATESVLAEIFAVVKHGVKVDFSEYKAPTIERRLARRMALRRVESREGYLELLRSDPDEVRAFYEDTLIHVTSFFRDPAAFEGLKTKAFPAILGQKPQGAPVRLWVAGCSTGEEVYSLIITLLEYLGDTAHAHPIQIFGSDLSERAIDRARAGIYADGAVGAISDERRRRYFTKIEGGYRINKNVRDLCVFVRHDLARDPPFSKVDLVSCRNLLIYFDQILQRRVLPMLHYALNQPGFLLLGRSEHVSGFAELFTSLDETNKLFERGSIASTLRFAPRSEVHPPQSRTTSQSFTEIPPRSVDVGKHLDRLMLARYAPPAVLVNDKLEILQFRGQTGAFLQPAPGLPQNNLIKMARAGLVAKLRATIAEAKQTMAPVRAPRVEIDQDGFTRTCDLVVVPFSGMPDAKEPLYVVLFEPAAETGGTSKSATRSRSRKTPLDTEVPRLEHELAATTEYLHSLIEEHSLTNGELGSVNEELVSGNEELQSLNEELETAKEELQSTNEEMTTVNDELQSRNQEVGQINSDLVNLLVTVDVPIIILDRDRRIRRFTPQARNILNVLPADVGRRFGDLTPNIDVPDLDRQIAEVIDTVLAKESEVQDRGGHWYRMQIRPYKRTDNSIDGAIVSLFDINALKHHISEEQQAKERAERADRAKDQFLATLSHELRTPLSSILLQAQLLRRASVENPKVRRACDAIERGTRMQAQLIEDLLDVSRIIAGKLNVELQPVELPALVRGVVESLAPVIQKKRFDFRVYIDDAVGLVSGDRTRLEQIVSNLLTNAIKFTPEDGAITVQLEKVEGMARLRVSDTGMGIDAAFLPRVFNRFSQEDSSNTRPHGGLGLGLAIVRHLAEAHGGSVRAESQGMGKGATFHVTLPLYLPGEQAVGASTPVRAAPGAVEATNGVGRLADRQILVVDDDASTREALTEMLSQTGAQVRTAGSADEGMAMLRELRPDVLLCDLAMPGEDGFTFIRRVRDLGGALGGNVPALALTGLAAEADRSRALQAGFQMHMAKPIDLDRLTSAVEELSESSRPPPPPDRPEPTTAEA